MNLEYRVLKSIGSGSFSTVYLAQSQRTSHYVAIKRIPISHLSQNILSHIHQEIEMVKGFHHPNVIECIDTYITPRTIYMVTEYCNEGCINITKRLDYSNLKSLFYQMLQGLEYLHKNRIVHRDIKPQNILIHNGIVKYCDFGFASSIREGESLMTTLCGTPLYMSPEQLHHQPYSYKTDIWSLGIVFYQLIYGRHPFGNPQSIFEYQKQILTTPVYEEENPFTEVLKSMLQVRPEKRKTTEELLSFPIFVYLQSKISDRDEDELDTHDDDEDIFDFESSYNERIHTNSHTIKTETFQQEVQRVLSDYNSEYIRNHIREDHFGKPVQEYSQSAPINIPSRPHMTTLSDSGGNSFGKLFQITNRVFQSGKQFLSNTLSL